MTPIDIMKSARSLLALLCLAAGLAACGGSQASSTGGSTGSYSSGRQSSVSTRYPSTCRPNQYVGNRRSKALHPPGDHNLPAPHNQVCFDSARAGEAAGYHLVGSGNRGGNSGSTGSSSGGPTSIVIPGHPRPREETYKGCPPSGYTVGDPNLNLLKNRIDPATKSQTVDLGSFLTWTWPRAVSTNRIWMADWTASERRAIYPHEDLPVSLVGYPAATKLEERESPNCEGKAGYDWHVWLAPRPHASRGGAVITETTPRIRAREHGFNLSQFAGFVSRGSRVRITGWTMLDYQHPEQVGWDRATLWEIHPITRIDVWRNGHWVKVAG